MSKIPVVFSFLSFAASNIDRTYGFSTLKLLHLPCQGHLTIFNEGSSNRRSKHTFLYTTLRKDDGTSTLISGDDDQLQKKIVAASLDDPVSILNASNENAKQDTSSNMNGGRTVNARLLDELNNSIAITKNPEPKIKALKSIAGFFASSKTDEERQRALAEARDLNGVNTFSCLAASAFCFAFAAALWAATNMLIELFVSHPLATEIYVIQRFTSVIRNVVIGITSLGAGFSAVTGLGLAALGIRVAYGVYITGELDPTPPVKKINSTTCPPTVIPGFSDQEQVDKFDAREAFALMFGNTKQRRRQK
jgi:hypothetical protein